MAIQLQDFAKQVLFGTTIEEKLSFPREEIIDTHPGSPISTPHAVSRPGHLSLYEDGVRVDHPSVAKLIDEKERGRLLHFFANHELLATELMALALLKFPDAPASFRKGLLQTLKDEQIHTRIYMRRMQQCGIEFGELPLSNYFWKSVSSMEDPLDYVTRLSLTFEQANLDYSREYSGIFERVGDKATAKILDRIYRDEIDHVGFGLKWFRKWKASGKTDWEVFRERLVFPLSPSRAKGNVFNAKGRSSAGLEDSFIKELEIFHQSRGRTPCVFWFNPEAETYAAQDSADGYDARENPVKDDLEFLPAYLSRKDDILIVSKAPKPEFLQTLQSYTIQLPEIVPNSPKSKTAPLIDRKIGDLRPWAWTPDSISYFKEIADRVTRSLDLDTMWNPERRRLFSKVYSARLARTINDGDWLAPAGCYGKEVRDFEEIEKYQRELRETGYSEIACKAPFGTAANGTRRIQTNADVPSGLRHWILETIGKQGSIQIEPWLERVFDFSIQASFREGQMKVFAYTELLNNPRGQFKGIIAGAFDKGLSTDLRRLLLQREAAKPRLYELYENRILPAVKNTLLEATYEGPISIDAFVYRSLSGELRLKPIVEINPRYTMGRVAHELSNYIASASVGLFQILNLSQLKKAGYQDFTQYSASQTRHFPKILSEAVPSKIIQGSFPVTDPKQAKRFLAHFHVSGNYQQLAQILRADSS
ncbi:MAG: DUF455 family protein [Verrucomicrobiota bacterium]